MSTTDPGKVLVVEDRDFDFELLERRFRRARPAPCLVRSPTVEAAARYLADVAPPPALVILDLQLADGHGDEVLALLRARPHTAKTPVLVWTGAPDPTLPARYRALGVHRLIRKISDGAVNTHDIDSMVHLWTEVAARHPR